MKIAAFIVAFLMTAPGINAAVFNVTNSTQLRNALAAAQNNGQNDTINIATGTFNTSGATFTYEAPTGENFSLSIIGAGSEATQLSGEDTTRVLSIRTPIFLSESDADITIKNLVIRNGNVTDVTAVAGGLSIRTRAASVTIENCRFTNNSVHSGSEIASGGGSSVSTESGDITLTNNVVDNNSASSDSSFAVGGGMVIGTVSGTATLVNNSLTLRGELNRVQLSQGVKSRM